VLFLDRLDVAVDSGADGVHLGQGDDYATARSRLGTDRLVGVSVATVADVTAAEAAGADYLGVTVWPTRTKPEAIAAGLAGLRAVTAATQLPVVGIGGIAAGNAEQVLGADAAGVGVILRGELSRGAGRGGPATGDYCAALPHASEQETEADDDRQHPGENRWGPAERDHPRSPRRR
jgi:hypothetical protein